MSTARFAMRYYTMPNSEARSKLRPTTSSDRRQLAIFAAYILVAIAAVCALHGLSTRNHDRIVQTWPNANATILDARTVPVGWWNSQFSSKLAFDVQVLVRYSAGSQDIQKWVTVQQQPRTGADAQFEIFRWKGQTCLIRWNPKNPDEVIAEIS